MKHKIYDFLPWDIERPVMLEKWENYVRSSDKEKNYVFNCVLLQNPMCETMMRFGSDLSVSLEYINSICRITSPLEPFVIYLRSDNIRSAIERALPERGEDCLNGVIDYHCDGAYGKAEHLHGFDGYIKALEERQHREIVILQKLGIRYLIPESPL